MATSNNFHIVISLYVSIIFFNPAWTACPDDWLNILTNATAGNPPSACYKIVPDQRRSFDFASTYCQNQGGYLARDTSQTVHDTLKPYIINAAKSATRPTTFWIGLTDNNVTNGPWIWVGGPTLGTFKDFASTNITNTPNMKDCGYVSTTDPNLRWLMTSDCNQYRAFICQRDLNGPLVTIIPLLPPNCPFGWTSYAAQRTCIRLYTSNTRTWTDARASCQQASGDLIKIGNANLSSTVSMLVNNQKGVYWIGLNDRASEGNFVWLDETVKADFTNWDSNMPNNAGGNQNCVALDANKNFKWSDTDCTLTNRYICQRSPLAGTQTTPAVATLSHVNCGVGWEDVPNSDECFKFNTGVLSWLDAQDACKTAGGQLASINNAQEQFYLVGRSLSFTSAFFWIGANDRSTERGWQWSDGSPFAFINWDSAQPDNSHNSDCAVLVQQSGRWDDLPCEDRYGYICKKKGKTTFTPLVTQTTTPGKLPGDVFFGCPTGWSGFRGSCYMVVSTSTPVNWATASQSCAGTTMLGALASIIDNAENNYIVSLMPKNYSNNAWIGLQVVQSSTFTWVDGTPVQYTNWNRGEPNNMNNENCVVMRTTNGKWNNAQCVSTYRLFVCKRSKSVLPNTDFNQNQGCPNNTFGYGPHCYNFVTSAKTFVNAQSDCRLKSPNQGNLATIDSGHLQAYLSSQLSTQAQPVYWIGLSQTASTYTWQSKSPVSFTYWGSNHTGNEINTCVAMSRAVPAGLWSNYPCTTPLPYVCESPRTGYTTLAPQATVSGQQQPCPSGWLGYGNRYCYRAFYSSGSAKLTWTDAENYCESQADGGTLVTVPDNVTQAWLRTNVLKSMAGNFWIGLNDRASESGYIWADNSPYLFSNWAKNEPNDANKREDCVVWGLNSNNWNDEYCYVSNNWICQVPRGSIVTTAKPTPTGVQSPQCGDATWKLYNNFCYTVYATLTSWFNARQKCLDIGADLASITAEDENAFVTTFVSKYSFYSYWLGLNDLDSETYGWTDLTPVGYVAWGENEPNDDNGNEKCVEITSLGYWNDDQCQTLHGYVCKKRPLNYSPSPPAPTVVSGGCPRNFVSIPSLSYCYYVGGTTNTTRKNYTDALTACEQMVHKSVLASIKSTLEQKYILVLIADSRYAAWIGFNDRQTSNKFVWVDGRTVSYTNWGPGQPDENLQDPSADARKDCVDMEIGRNPGTWNDRQCSTTLAYVCQSDKGATLPTTAPNTTGCNAGYLRFRNSCYGYYQEPLNWTSAEAMCTTQGGNLASVGSAIEQAFVELLTQRTEPLQLWIGLEYVLATASFNWVDGWPVRFTNWGKDEPNLQGGYTCVSHTTDEHWQVVNCEMPLPFVCEIQFGSPPPTRTFPPGRCPDGTWFNYAGSCYHIETSSPVSWAQANTACRNMGANLTSIHTDRESRYLTNVIGAAGKNVWIGLFKGQGTGFTWYDGSGVQYTYWGTGEPNDPDSYLHQDCVMIVSQYGTWADTDCGDKNAYICKMAQQARPSLGPNATYPSRGTGFRSRPRFSGSPFSRNGSRPPYTGSSRRPFRGSSRGPNRYTAAASGGNSSSGLSGGAVAGVVIGTLILVALVAVIGFFVYRYSRGYKIPIFSGAQRLVDPPPAGFENASYSSSQDNKVKLDVTDSQAEC